ncbi:hypothetical protein BU25DRAFT_453004 [Macroventuria anomochaeta]|uniref:Uncharacterized protein n=1 Tax=Macroventuria anomochaeta TaxID=301207 RepID=A0ACB6SIJ6_9PLEO|nr:uncharacterized protein BU25DRAFT_453004 [Macroventuria anomochaeta]KAF2633203.1 hypothetical protein BU25DRAFT_453004 [Macroventuria anomochaeta]
MWSLENHRRERGRSFENKPSVLREYSSSPPRTPKAPLHTPDGFIVHGTPGAHDRNSYFSLPMTSPLAENNTMTDTAESANTSSSIELHSALPKERNNTEIAPDTHAVDSDVLELWTALDSTVQSDSDSTSSNVAEPASPSEDTVMTDAQVSPGFTITQTVPEVSYHTFDEPFIFDTVTSELTCGKRASSFRSNSASKRAKILISLDPDKTMFHNARSTSVQFLQSLLDSPKLDIVNEITGEVYVKSASLHMLEYFCGGQAINSLVQRNCLLVPPTHVSRDGIIRVIRYMRRWCQDPSVRPTGELRTPPSIKEGIATSLACRFLHLDANAQHMEDLVVQDFMGSPRFFITDEDVELIWCGYEETLRDTSFGDAVVWFVLEHIMGGTHALADEVRWMLEQEEYEDLKARIRYELKEAEWRGIGRKAFLERCLKDREEMAAYGEGGDSHFSQDGSVSRAGGSNKDKPLPRLPASS